MEGPFPPKILEKGWEAAGCPAIAFLRDESGQLSTVTSLHLGKGLAAFCLSSQFSYLSSPYKVCGFKLHDSSFQKGLGSVNQISEHWSVQFIFSRFLKALKA